MHYVSFSPSKEYPWSFLPLIPTIPSPPTPPAPTNPQDHINVSSDGKVLTMVTTPKSDWWRTTWEHRGSGLSYVLPVAVKVDEKVQLDSHGDGDGGLKCGVGLWGDWEINYDQAALMIYLSPTIWLKTGIEFTQGKPWISVVVNDRYSDWSLIPFPEGFPTPSASNPLRLSVQIINHHMKVLLQLPNGEKMMIREKPAFAFDATKEEIKSGWKVGVMGCSPTRENDGVNVGWDGFWLN